MSTDGEKSQDPTADHPTEGISDEDLPKDLRPGEDNPLAEPLEEGEEIEGTSPPKPDQAG